jgi:uncharacterized membrane protein
MESRDRRDELRRSTSSGSGWAQIYAESLSMLKYLKLPEERDPRSRMYRNMAMTVWLLIAAAIIGLIGILLWHWTRIPALLAPPLVIGALVYAGMAIAAYREQR